MSARETARSSDRRLTQAERTALSDRRMFDAAIDLINERGTQKTTLKEVGERAGYSRGLAHYRFGSKDGLMLELFERFDDRWKAHLDEHLHGATGLEAVNQALLALQSFLSKESGYMRAMYLLWYESLGHQSEMRRILAEHHDVYREDAQRWIEQGMADGDVRPGTDAGLFAIQFCAFVFGMVYQWLVNADSLDIDAVFRDYIENLNALMGNADHSKETAS